MTYSSLVVYTSLSGHAVGVANPDSVHPQTDAVSLLVAVTFVPVLIQDWMEILGNHDNVGDAAQEVVNTYGGVVILRPTDIHLDESPKHIGDPVEGVH